MGIAENKQVVLDFYEYGARRDIDSCFALMAEDITWTNIGTTKLSGTYVGKQAIAGVDEETIMMLIQVTYTLVGALVGIVVWSALRKEYSDFRIALVPRAPDPLSDTGQQSRADPPNLS